MSGYKNLSDSQRLSQSQKNKQGRKYYKDQVPFEGTISSLIIEGSHTKPKEKKAVLQALSRASSP